FGEAFGFFVHAAQADGVNVAPEIFALDVFGGIAVDFGSAGDEEAGFFFEGNVEEVPGALGIYFHGFDAMRGVGDGGGRGGEVIDAVEGAVDFEGFGDVLLEEGEAF